MNRRINASLLIICLLSLPVMAQEISLEIQTAIANKQRDPGEVSRDKGRKPEQILSLLGIEPGMKVADLCSGGGYYTDLLARVVGPKGQVIAHNAPWVINQFSGFFLDEKNGWPSKFQQPHWQNVVKNDDELDTINLPVGLDAAMMILFYHDTVWQGVNRQMMNRRIFNALKPGGVYLIVDHSAKSGTGLQDVETLHRIDKKTVIEEITSVGFELVTDSELLSHAEDTRDYPFWRDTQTNRDATDRMVLKFQRPNVN